MIAVGFSLASCTPLVKPATRADAKRHVFLDRHELRSVCQAEKGANALDADEAWYFARGEFARQFGWLTVWNERPFSIVDLGDKYIVYGSLPGGYDGGVAETAMCKAGGRMLYVEHGK